MKKIILLLLALLLLIPVVAMTSCGDEECEEHTWKAATCTAPKTCTVCGATEGAVAGHKPVSFGAKDATCTEAGVKAGTKCSVCGVTITATSELPATGHSYGAWEVVTEATCVTAGEKKQTCSVCGDVVKEVIPATGAHSYGDWEVITYPNCTNAGEQQKSCSVCGDVVKETIPVNGNEHVDSEDFNSICDLCGKEICYHGEVTETVSNVVEATCTTAGSYDLTITCNICGAVTYFEPVIVPATGHSDADENGVCDVCEVELNAFDKYFITASKFTESGFGAFVVEYDLPEGVTKAFQFINRFGNVYAFVYQFTDAAAATAYVEGLETTDEVVEAIDAIVIQGTAEAVSYVKGESEPEPPAPPCEHTNIITETRPGTPATCVEPGDHFVITLCNDCGMELGFELVDDPATGEHNYVDGACSVCGKSEDDECAHEWTPATCTAPKTCSKCGVTEGDVLPHTEETIPAVDATCSTPGATKGKKCSVCGEILVAPTPTEIDPSKHTYSEDWTSTEEEHYKVCTGCSAESAHIPHLDANTDGICDTCKYVIEEIPEILYYNVTFKALAFGVFQDVRDGFDPIIIKVAQNTAMTEENLKALAAVRFQGYGFKAWYTDEEFANEFDPTAVIDGDIVLYGDRGDLAGVNITWAHDPATKTLTLTGEGEMFNFSNVLFVPWNGLDVENVVIDERITSIGSYSFYVEAIANTGMRLTSITFNEGLKQIGDYAFYGESLLTEVKFPASLEQIGANAFRACKGLTYIDIGGENLKKVNEYSFAECEKATYVIFNGAVEDSAGVFYLCKFTHAYFAGNKGQFEAVEIGFDNIQLDLAYMFYYTSYEPQKAGPYWYRDAAGAPAQWCYSIYYIPSDGIQTAIAKDYVFVKNPKVSADNIAFRDAIWYQGYQFEGWTGNPVFAEGTTLTGDVKYTGVRGGKVGDGVDHNITGNVLTISGSGKMWDFGTVTSAPWYQSSSFENTAITEVVIGANVTYIGDYAFCNFPNLQSIEIRSNIVEMSTKAFYGCANLKYVYYYGNELEALNCKGLNNQENVANLVVYCKEMQIDGICDTCGEIICDHVDLDSDKKCDECGSDFCAHVDENTDGKCDTCKKIICTHLDRDISYLTEKGILPTIRYWKDVEVVVGDATVSTRITWEFVDGVLSVGGEGIIPDVLDGEKTPWAATFDMICKEESLGFKPINEAVTSIVVRAGVTAIGDNAFAGLSAATSITLPRGLTRISKTAFTGAAFLTEESLWSDGFLVINNCLIKADPEALGERVLLNNALVCIADGAFEGCSQIVEMRMPKTLIGATALSYEGLDSLTTIFFHGIATDWANNGLDISVPETVQVYFFSNREPSGCGYYWKTLNNPTIWVDYIPNHTEAPEDAEWVVVIEPTCTTPGLEELRCPNCDYAYDSREITAEHVDEDGDFTCDKCGALA